MPKSIEEWFFKVDSSISIGKMSSKKISNEEHNESVLCGILGMFKVYGPEISVKQKEEKEKRDVRIYVYDFGNRIISKMFTSPATETVNLQCWGLKQKKTFGLGDIFNPRNLCLTATQIDNFLNKVKIKDVDLYFFIMIKNKVNVLSAKVEGKKVFWSHGPIGSYKLDQHSLLVLPEDTH